MWSLEYNITQPPLIHLPSQQAPSTKGGLLAIKPGYGLSQAATALLAGGGDVAHVSVFRCADKATCLGTPQRKHSANSTAASSSSSFSAVQCVAGHSGPMCAHCLQSGDVKYTRSGLSGVVM